MSCPPKVTADSGIDALTHAIEAYTAVDNADFPLPPGERSVYQGQHPMGDMWRRRRSALRPTPAAGGRHGDDLEAREGMALAATLAGLAFSNVGVALVHALEYPVGGATHCSHGAGNGLLLPYVMRFNLPARRREFARIAELLGEDVGGLGEAERGRAGDRRRGAVASRHRHSAAAARPGREGRAVAGLRREGVGDQAHPARQSAAGDARPTARRSTARRCDRWKSR